MAEAHTREELIAQLRKAQEQRGGVKSYSLQSPVTRESVEFMSDAEIEASINAIKRELRELDNPAPRIFNIQARKGY
ncbi:hypothetical protein [Shinella zoogloeoides]|uniref:hypothetical protein n=1 Tax=Shinella zoogloeoides TaxID=352475 RepID=UPI001F566561|nr:hypothetical protein [Shinella zoogloeoides]